MAVSLIALNQSHRLIYLRIRILCTIGLSCNGINNRDPLLLKTNNTALFKDKDKASIGIFKSMLRYTEWYTLRTVTIHPAHDLFEYFLETA